MVLVSQVVDLLLGFRVKHNIKKTTNQWEKQQQQQHLSSYITNGLVMQAAVSGYAEKYLRVVHVPRTELTTSEISEMRDAVATWVHLSV